jgi:hypothetical protein
MYLFFFPDKQETCGFLEPLHEREKIEYSVILSGSVSRSETKAGASRGAGHRCDICSRLCCGRIHDFVSEHQIMDSSN